jgi:hypothetical protein
MALGRRVAWHARSAWRASRFTVLALAAGGALLPAIVPVEDAWLASAVAGTAALLALLLLAAAESKGAPLPAAADGQAALERLGAADLCGLVLVRASMALGAFALGLAAGGAIGGLNG